jgi:hypothetical protein
MIKRGEKEEERLCVRKKEESLRKKERGRMPM